MRGGYVIFSMFLLCFCCFFRRTGGQNHVRHLVVTSSRGELWLNSEVMDSASFMDVTSLLIIHQSGICCADWWEKINITLTLLKRKKIKCSSWKFISLTDVISWVNTRSTLKLHHQLSAKSAVNVLLCGAATHLMNTIAGLQTHHHDTVSPLSEKWGGVFPRLVRRIQNITTSTSWKPHKSSGAYRTKEITWHRGAADAKGFNFGNDKGLHSESRVVGSRLSVQARSGDGSIINTVWVKPMTCFCCYPLLSDLSRKDGGEIVGGEQSTVGGWEQGGWRTLRGARKGFSLPLSGLSIALSLLIRKLMQLSVLILESSFYSFFFFSFATFFYSVQH